MRMAFFDLSGTILQYGKDKPIPLMEHLLRALGDQEWEVGIVSRHTQDHCNALLARAGIDCPVSIFPSGGATKGATISRILKQARYDESIFVDDKPENLASVLQECAGNTRIIGFVGSRRYTPELSRWCLQHGIELALSSLDLCEGLRIHADSTDLLNSDGKWNEEELVALIPGSDHPLSALLGETGYFDHRAVLTELLENRHVQDYGRLWRNIAWITCNECLWKALVRTVLRSLSLDLRQVLGTADTHDEYTDALNDYASRTSNNKLRQTFEGALAMMEQGVQEIGVEAEMCRIADRAMDRDRIARARVRIQDALKFA
jgi:hypothetical protein